MPEEEDLILDFVESVSPLDAISSNLDLITSLSGVHEVYAGFDEDKVKIMIKAVAIILAAQKIIQKEL